MTSKELNRKKQRDYYLRKKEAGMVTVRMMISQEELETLKQMYEGAYDPGNTFEEFKRKCLITGGAFVGSVGKGKGERWKKTPEGYKRGKDL